MDSVVLSLTCAGLGASQEDEDGAVIGYAKSDHCLGTPAPFPLPALLRRRLGFDPISDRRMCLLTNFCCACVFAISVDNLKDLQRFLRRDDPQRREVFKQVCKWKIASRDLVPIIENYQTDRNLVITAGNCSSILIP